MTDARCEAGPGASTETSVARRRIALKAGSALACVDVVCEPVSVQTHEVCFLRELLQGELAGEPDSFQLRYRLAAAAAAAPTCALTWWPPTDDMLAIIEAGFRAALLSKAPAQAESGPVRSKPNQAGGAPEAVLTIELATEMYGQLLQHQTAEALRFDRVIQQREEQQRAAAEAQRIREEEAEAARLERKRAVQEELDALVKQGGRAARSRLALLKKQMKEEEEIEKTESAAAPVLKKAEPPLYATAWPGAMLTCSSLEAAFARLPVRPSGSQVRYLYNKRSHYCEPTGYLTTEGFCNLARDLGFLQADLALQRKAASDGIFAKMDTQRKGEIALSDFLAQIKAEDQGLAMLMVDTLLNRVDHNKNGLLDRAGFQDFYAGWLELQRIFAVYDDCRLEEMWSNRDYLEGHLSFTDVELLSSVFLGIKAKAQHGKGQVAYLGPVVASLDVTTLNPSQNEVEAALVACHQRSDAMNFVELLDLHRHLRAIRANPQHVPMRAADVEASPEDMGPANSESDTVRDNEGERAEKLQVGIDDLREKRAATDQLEFLQRRKQIPARVSTSFIEGFLRRPTLEHQPGARSSKFDKPALISSLDHGATQERRTQDVLNLTKLLWKSPNLAAMPEKTLFGLAQCCTTTFIPGKAVIYDLEDWGSGFWVIIVGIANVMVKTQDGKRHKVAELRAGQTFGEMFLLFGEHLARRFIVEASTDGVLAAFVEREDYFAIGLDAYHRDTTWKDLSKKHSLLISMPGCSHLDPTETFHLCHQLRAKTVAARSEVYNAETEYIDAPKADYVFRDSSVLQEKGSPPLLFLQEGSCDVWVDRPKEQKKAPTSHERDLSQRAQFLMNEKRAEMHQLLRISNLAPGAIFGSFATGPLVRKITASDTSSVTVYQLRPQEALSRLRRDGIQKIFQERESREQFILSCLDESSTQKTVASLVKGERSLKTLTTMLQAPKLDHQVLSEPETDSESHTLRHLDQSGSMQPSREGLLAISTAASQSSLLSIGSESDHKLQASTHDVKSQYRAGNPVNGPKGLKVAVGSKPPRSHARNTFGTQSLDLVEIISRFRGPVAKDNSHVITRGEQAVPLKVPAFSKSPAWLDSLEYRLSVPVKDPLRTRESEAQHKIYEAFCIYENLQNLGKGVDLSRYMELMKASHLVGSKTDPRDNLMTSITLGDAIVVFKQVAGASLPTASLLRGRVSVHPVFELSRFDFSQCMNLVAKRLRVSMPTMHTFPIAASAGAPASSKSSRVSLSGVTEDMHTVIEEKKAQAMQSAAQEQMQLRLSGRPGSSSYKGASSRRPATSCGFSRATGTRGHTADSMGRMLSGPQKPSKPHSSLTKMMPSRPGSTCVVSMLIPSETLRPQDPNLQGANSSLPPSTLPDNRGLTEHEASRLALDQIYGPSQDAGVLAHIEQERKKRTRSIKRSLKRLNLPEQLRQQSDKPAHKHYMYQMLQNQLYGQEEPKPSLHWINQSVANAQLHATPSIAQHEHLHTTPVFFSPLSRASLITAQQCARRPMTSLSGAVGSRELSFSLTRAASSIA